MDFTLDELKNTEAYKSATPEGQAQIERKYTQDAWAGVQRKVEYATGSEERRQGFAEQFNVEHAMGAEVQREEENLENTFLENMGLRFAQGARTAGRGFTVSGDVTLDRPGKYLASAVVAQRKDNRTSHIPQEEREAIANFDAVEKAFDQRQTAIQKLGDMTYNPNASLTEHAAALAGLTWRSAKSHFELAFEAAEAIVSHPKGAAYMAAGSGANILTSHGTGLIAGLAAGNVPGAFAGMVTGGYLGEAGIQYIDRISQEVERRGLSFTEENVQKVIDDSGVMSEIADKSRRKAFGTAITDAVLSLGGAKALTAPAKRITSTAAKDILLGSIKKPVKAGAHLVKEGVSEATSEVAGQLLADKEVDISEAIAEAAAGGVAGPVTAPVSAALVTTEKAAKATLKAAIRKDTPEQKKLKEQAKSPTQYKFEEKVDTLVKEGTAKETLDPKSEKFDPLMGVQATSKMNQKKETTPIQKAENFEQAGEALKHFEDKRQEIGKRIQDTMTKMSEGKDTLSDKEYGKLEKERTAALKELKQVKQVIDRMTPHIEAMKDPGTDKETALKKVNEVIEQEDKRNLAGDAILSVFGSRQADSLSESKDMGKLEQVVKGTPMETLFNKFKAYQQAEKVVTDRQKTTKQVYEDVINGGPGKLGIRDYSQNIANALLQGDTKAAQKNLSMLKTFAARQTTKARVFTAVMEGRATPQEQAQMDQYNADRVATVGKPYVIGPQSASLVGSIQQEANALSKAVEFNQEAIRAKAGVKPRETVSGQRIQGEVSVSPKAKPKDKPAPTEPMRETVERVARKEPTEKGPYGDEGIPWETTIEEAQEMLKKAITDQQREELEDFINFRQWQEETTIEEKDVPLTGEVEGMFPGLKPSDQVTKERQLKQWLAFNNQILEKEVTDERVQDETPETRYVDQSDQKEVLDKVSDLEEAGRQPELKEEDEVQEAERGEDGKAPEPETPYVRHDLTTPTESDPNNDIKNTFKYREEKKGILNNTVGDLLSLLTPDVLVDMLPKEQKPANMLKDMRAFGGDFRNAFFKEFKYRPKGGVTNHSVFRNKIRFGKKLVDDKPYKEPIIAEIDKTFSGRENITPQELRDFADRHKDLLGIETVTEYAESLKDNRRKDPIQFLTDKDGKIHQRVVDALMATSFDWIATRAEETLFNEESDIQRMLSLRDTQKVPDEIIGLLQQVGKPQPMLIEQLGKKAYNLLGIQPTDKASDKMEENLQNALGLQLLTTLQSLGLIEQIRIDSSAVQGLSTIIREGEVTDLSSVKDSLIVPPDAKKIKAEVNYYKIVTDQKGEMIKPLKEGIQKSYKEARDAWSILFEGEPDKRNYTWDQPEVESKAMPMKRTSFFTSKKQGENVTKNSAEPWEMSNRTMGFWKLLGQEKMKEILLGTTAKIPHRLNEDSVRGIEAGIGRTLRSVDDWIDDAKRQGDGLRSRFYIDQYFVRQGRMHQQSSINPQGDKAHRSLFRMAEWSQLIDLGNKEHVDRFLEAVAFGFDIETTKRGGMAGSINSLNKLLEKPIMQDALHAIHTIMDEEGVDELDIDEMGELTGKYSSEIDAIVKGVHEGEMKVRSLKSLIEYARYQKYMADGVQEFESDIWTEVDGVSNGIFFALVQLMGKGTDFARTLASTQNMGMKYTEDQSGLAEHLSRDLSYDAYKATGSVWATKLLQIEEKLVAEVEEKDHVFAWEKLMKFKALSRLFGEFKELETGAVSSAARKASKAPTMRTVYGMQDNSLKRELQDAFYKDMKAKIEKIANLPANKQDEAIRELNKLNTDIRELLGHTIFPENVINQNGDIDRAILTEAWFTEEDIKAINRLIKVTHFKALSSAINEIYAPIKEAFRTLNGGINLQAAQYNTVRKLFLQNLRQQAYEQNREVTVGEIKKLDKAIHKMFPQVKTYSGAFMPLAKMSREKDRGKAQVEQQYRGMPVKKAAPNRDQGVEMPGVGGTVVTNHNQDSQVANNTMGQFAMLNNHDGFSTGILNAMEMAMSANKTTYEVLSKFHMGLALHAGLENSHKHFKQHKLTLMNEYGFTPQEINKALAEEIQNITLDKTTYGNFFDAEGRLAPEDVNDIVELITKESLDTAKLTKKNKDELLSAVVGVEQYSYPGAAYKTGNKPKKIRFGNTVYAPTKITENMEKRLTEGNLADRDLAETLAKTTHEYVAEETVLPYDKIEQWEESGHEGIYSSSQVNISIDPQDYSMRQEINEENLTQVYDRIKDQSTKVDNTEHSEYLRGLLTSLVQKVMQPLDLFVKTDPTIEATGQFVETGSGRNRVFMSHQINQNYTSGVLNQGIRMSSGEVYAHEMTHAVLVAAMKIRPKLRKQVEKLFKVARKEITPKDFATDPNDPYEMNAAYDRYDYIFNNTDTAGNGTNTYLDEFLAFALTNENMKAKLSTISLIGSEYRKPSWRKIIGTNVQETMMNLFEFCGDILHQGFRKFVTKDLGSNVAEELTSLAHYMVAKDSATKSQIYQGLEYTSVKYGKLLSLSNALIKDTVGKFPIVRTAQRLRNSYRTVKASNTHLGQFLRELTYKYQTYDQNLAKSIVQEIGGRTDRLGWVHDLIHHRNIFLDQAKQEAIDYNTSLANSLFKQPLKEEAKVAIAKVLLKGDASVLLNDLGMGRLAGMCADPAAIEREIQATMTELDNISPNVSKHLTYYRRAARAMGHHMIHGTSRSDEIAFPNAWVIAALHNHPKEATLTSQEINFAEVLIDRLGSLFALSYTSLSNRAKINELISSDPDGVNGVMRMHEVLKEDAKQKTFRNSKAKFVKGYTKQILNSRIQLAHGTLQDEREMARKGFVRSERPLSRDNMDPTRGTAIYTYTSRNGRVNDLASMLFSYTANVARGTASDKLAAQTSLSTDEGRLNNADIIKKKRLWIRRMANPTYTPRLQPGNHMIPQVDDIGRITKYRYMMAEETKDNQMEQVNAFDTILGAMAGQLVDKVRTPEVNKLTVQGLKAMYDEEFRNNPGAFVEIGLNSSNPDHREMYQMLPKGTRMEIKRVWNEDRMWVAKDALDMIFGYRSYDVVEAFSKDPQDRAKLEKVIVSLFNTMFGEEKGARRAGTLQSVAIELAKYAKNNIIVKSFHVTLGNLGSNLIYLKTKGVPVSKIITVGLEAMVQGTKYQAQAKQLAHLEGRRRIAVKDGKSPRTLRRIDAEITRLKDSIARNPVTRSIKAGLMPSLVDDVETVTSGTAFPTEFEKKVVKATSKLPSLVQNVGKIAFLTEETVAYKLLNNAVKMTDFIGRHVLFNHYLNQGMEQEEATHRCVDEFVNFSIPTHRMIEFANNIGLLYFTKYGFRILRVIMENVKERPADVFASYMLSSSLGFDNIMNSVPGVTKDPFANIGNPLFTFLGSLEEPVTAQGVGSLLK